LYKTLANSMEDAMATHFNRGRRSIPLQIWITQKYDEV
jgi:hypothetical protein